MPRQSKRIMQNVCASTPMPNISADEDEEKEETMKQIQATAKSNERIIRHDKATSLQNYATSAITNVSNHAPSTTVQIRKMQTEIAFFQQRDQIEQKRRELEIKIKQIELEHQMKIANIENELIDNASVRESLRSGLEEDRQSIHSKHSDVSEWVHQHQQQQPNKYDDNIEVNEFCLKEFLARQTIAKDLPTFSGEPIDWPSFYNEFIHSSKICKFSDYENLSRLRKSLTGRAKEAVYSLLSMPQNVNEIIDILKSRFGNSDHIIRQLIDKVRNFQNLKDDKIENLIRFYDLLTSLIYTLKSFDDYDNLRNPTLFEEVLNKISLFQRLAFMQHFGDLSTIEPRIVVFHKWLGKKVNAANSLGFGQTKAKDSTLTIVDDSTKQKIRCTFCNDLTHKIINCEKFKKLRTDERWTFVTKNHLCIGCLGKGHVVKTCQRRKICKVDDCSKSHNKLLHKISSEDRGKDLQSKTDETIQKNFNINFSNSVSLKVIPVILSNRNKTIQTFALLDDASTVTLIDTHLAEELELDGPTKHLRLQWTNNDVIEQENSKIVSMQIKGTSNNSKTFILRYAKTINGLALPTQSLNVESLSEQWPFFKDFSNLSFNKAQPRLLIGQDNWPLIVSRKLKYEKWNGPVLSKTLLGWVIHGNFSNENVTSNRVYHIFDCSKNEQNECDDLSILHKMVKDHWKLEGDSIHDKNKDISQDDIRCSTIIDKTLKRVGERFECGLFWAHDNKKLPESYDNAYSRLCSLESKMKKNDMYRQNYIENFNNYIDKGYLKKLNHAEANIITDFTYYLPHFGVINPNKPGKLRIVFDAAAKNHGYCLNDFLLTGPDLYNSLATVLLNFRKNKVAFVGDIREMFLQIRVRESDRHAQRILWRESDNSVSPDIYEIQVLFFGAKCSPSIAQYVKNRNALDFKYDHPEAYNDIVNQHYMDDYLGGADSIEEAYKLANTVHSIHEKGGFEIRNWVSNSSELMSQLQADSGEIPEKTIGDAIKEERVLGLVWNFKKDTFSYQLKFHKVHRDIFNLARRPTKREVLKVTMAIFDPMGFLTNFLIGAKILLQSIWESGMGWDEQILDEHYTIWKKWCAKLEQLSEFAFPRLITDLPIDKCDVELHIFCDASKYAYAACAYLRFKYEDKIECTLIMSKSRVAPLKPTSIPRLELQAAVLAARLSKILNSTLNFNIKRTTLWSDSEVFHYWLRLTDRRFKVFVAQRLGEIREITNTADWRYVPSKLNIADDATKIKHVNFSKDSIWIKGPEFLYGNEGTWPTGKFSGVTEDLREELSAEFVGVISHKTMNIELPNVTRFSKWFRFLRATSWMLRFVKFYKLKNYSIPDSELTPDEIFEAENFIFRKIQNDSYRLEIDCLINKKQIPKNSKLATLPLILQEDNLIRLKGRLDKLEDINVDYNLKNPIVLDHRHPITDLIIHHYHVNNSHIGNETIILNLRHKFWITNCRSAVKKSALNCQNCRNKKAKPTTPIMAQLPLCRIDPTVRPFVKTGVDYFGPIEVSVNRKVEKRYGAIFTCMTTRAVHLEIAHDLSSNAFIHIFRQFGNRRGFPLEMYSDNGTNFRKADREIREAIDSWPKDEMTQYMTMKNCKWFFNPPLAPHMGGAWERLIQDVKKHLFSLLKAKHPKEYVLRTFFTEVENMMNNRPLTHVPLDSHDANPLTPNDLLIGPLHSSLQFAQTDDQDLHFLNMWRASQRLSDIFWERWKREYRQHILFSRKWSKDYASLQEGDVVLIIDNETARNTWPKGIIIKIYPSQDKRVRVVDVKTAFGIYKRAVTKLIKLDVRK